VLVAAVSSLSSRTLRVRGEHPGPTNSHRARPRRGPSSLWAQTVRVILIGGGGSGGGGATNASATAASGGGGGGGGAIIDRVYAASQLADDGNLHGRRGRSTAAAVRAPTRHPARRARAAATRHSRSTASRSRLMLAAAARRVRHRRRVRAAAGQD
jgi:hypothetical protein